MSNSIFSACPFCGCKEIMFNRVAGEDIAREEWVECPGCGARCPNAETWGNRAQPSFDPVCSTGLAALQIAACIALLESADKEYYCDERINDAIVRLKKMIARPEGVFFLFPANDFREWFVSRGGEAFGVSLEKASEIWDAATKSAQKHFNNSTQSKKRIAHG